MPKHGGTTRNFIIRSVWPLRSILLNKFSFILASILLTQGDPEPEVRRPASVYTILVTWVSKSQSSISIRRNSRRGSSRIIIILASMNSWKPVICISSPASHRVRHVHLHRASVFRCDYSRPSGEPPRGGDTRVKREHQRATSGHTRRKATHWNPTRHLHTLSPCQRIFLRSPLVFCLFNLFFVLKALLLF